MALAVFGNVLDDLGTGNFTVVIVKTDLIHKSYVSYI